jgi:hypothetical protein
MNSGTRRWLLLTVAVCVPLLVVWTGERLAIDKCLDAGGSYDYTHSICDRHLSHPLVPFGVRHPALLRGTVAIVLLLVAFGLFTRWRSKRAAA